MIVLTSDIAEFFSHWPVIAICTLCVICGPLGHWRKDFINELVGSVIMIVTLFPAGIWVGTGGHWQACGWHAGGVVLADWISGGPHVNPTVSLTMLALGKLRYPEFLCRVSAQLAGGVLTFPICRWFAKVFELPMFGGPTFDPAKVSLAAALWDEGVATFILCCAIFLLNWELPVRKNYLAKQSLTAAVIRFNIEMFCSSGCAMNPMIGTCWAIFLSSEAEGGRYAFPGDSSHYWCYWIAGFTGALLASLFYSLCSGTQFFGWKLQSRAKSEKRISRSTLVQCTGIEFWGPMRLRLLTIIG